MVSEKMPANKESSGDRSAARPAGDLTIQRKLTIGAEDDPLEQEADAMADRVLRMPEPGLIQRKCAHCEEEEKLQRKPLASFIQRKGNGGAATANDAIAGQISSSKGSGHPLDGGTKTFMESRFGADFSAVRIHNGPEAVQLSRQLNAQAFTVGSDIYFNEGKYAPESTGGKHLLAHELTHTIQQGGVIRKQAIPALNRIFTHHGVRVIVRASCDKAAFGLNKVETSFKQALDKIFLDTCIEGSRRKAIQANLKKNGYDVRCRDSNNLANKGACAESTGFSIPANIMTLGSNAFAGGACGDLASTILHEIIHVTRGRFEEDVSAYFSASSWPGPSFGVMVPRSAPVAGPPE